jgi:hypothetical protein
VVVYRLITCGTVEEKIYRKQVFKGALARAGTEQANPMRYFTHDELGRLFEASMEGLDVSQTQLHLNQVRVTPVGVHAAAGRLADAAASHREGGVRVSQERGANV